MARVCLGDGLSGENTNSVDGELIIFVKRSIRHRCLVIAADSGSERCVGGEEGGSRSFRVCLVVLRQGREPQAGSLNFGPGRRSPP